MYIYMYIYIYVEYIYVYIYMYIYVEYIYMYNIYTSSLHGQATQAGPHFLLLMCAGGASNLDTSHASDPFTETNLWHLGSEWTV